MPLSSALGEVLSLQSSYDSHNTPEMHRRGLIVRREIPSWLNPLRTRLAAEARLAESDLLIQGSDGAGRKAVIPWVRFGSRARTPTATSGWYVVFLFRRDGAGVYLTLAHASTNFVGGALVPKDADEVSSLLSWARSALGPEFDAEPRLTSQIDLGGTQLAAAYEKSSLVAIYYPREELPTDEAVTSDLGLMAKLLGRIYAAEVGSPELTSSPEIADAQSSTDAIANPRSRQGFKLSNAERKVIEDQAMLLAALHFTNRGYSIKDVSLTQPYDLLGKRGDETIAIEVKGTTSSGLEILLTKNEVNLHKLAHPHNALVVVSGINLDTSGLKPKASGGALKVTQPWLIDDTRLTALSFAYALPN